MQTANNEIGTIVRGDCDLCGHWSGNLINGACAYCDGRGAAHHEPGDIVELERQPHVLETASGRVVSITDPKPDQISIKDIAHHLARVNRFNGATSGRFGLSVAQHSVWVARYLERSCDVEHGAPDSLLALYGLLHDAAEAYLGDVTRPVKHVPGIHEAYKRLERRMLAVIYDALGLQEPDVLRRQFIAHADDLALAVEADELCVSRGRGPIWPDLPAADDAARHADDEIAADLYGIGYRPSYPLEPTMAEALFMQCYADLRGRVGGVS